MKQSRWNIAGKELIKGNIGNAFKAVTSQEINPMTHRSTGDFWLFQQNGADIHFSYGNVNSSLTAYHRCPPLAAIINRKAQAYINGKTWVLSTQGRSKGKESTGEAAVKLRKLFKKVNPLQSWRQFEAQNYIYQQVAGFCVVLPMRPIGFDNTEATSLWNIPPQMLDIKEKKGAKFMLAKSVKDLIESIDVVWGGERTPLNLDDIFIFRDFTPSLTSLVLPESRIRANSQVVSNIIGAYESRGVLIDSRGPAYIISSDQNDDGGNIPLESGQKDELEKEFKTRYGLRRGQINAILTSAAIKVQTMGFSTRDLMLMEEIEDDIMRLCDAYTYPYQLMASAKGTTFANMNDAKKLLYQDAIIPEAETVYEQWNNFFSLENYGLTLDKDFSHIPALQEDRLNDAKARRERNNAALIEFQNNMLTLNEWRELNNDDPLEGELGNKYYYELVAMGISFGKVQITNVQNDQQSNNNPETAN